MPLASWIGFAPTTGLPAVPDRGRGFNLAELEERLNRLTLKARG